MKLTCQILLLLFLTSTHASYSTLDNECEEDLDCRANWEYCSTSSTCTHKPLFPMLDLDYIGSLFTLFSLIFANAGGIGGGGIMIPTCVAFFGMNTKNAIAISNVSIFFSGSIRYVFNRNKINP